MKNRLDNLKQELISQKLDAVLISKVANIIYLTNYSGFSVEEREAYLLITPKKAFIFTDGRYTEAVKKLIPDFELIEISSKSKFSDILQNLTGKLKIERLGTEQNDLRVNEYKVIKKITKSLIDFKFHHHRSVKTLEEIRLIENACKIGDQAFKYIQTKIKLGISEKELMFLLDQFIREKGFEPSFKTIVGFGENSAIPHHQTGQRKLRLGDFVLLDFGVRFQEYCSDMTRTLIFGKPSEKQKRIYEVVKEAQSEATKFIGQKLEASGSRVKRGMTVSIKAAEVDKTARDYILENNFPAIPHSLGHGIGIEVHEHPYLSPNSKEELTEGMVFSIEPGIYIPGFGGVRIEDLFVIEKSRIRKLTKSDNNFITI